MKDRDWGFSLLCFLLLCFSPSASATDNWAERWTTTRPKDDEKGNRAVAVGFGMDADEAKYVPLM